MHSALYLQAFTWVYSSILLAEWKWLHSPEGIAAISPGLDRRGCGGRSYPGKRAQESRQP